MLVKFKPEGWGKNMRSKKGQLIAGLVLVTVGALFVLDRLFILEIYTSWPLILVAVAVGLFLSNPHSLGSWIIGGIGVILFVVNFAIAFFPEVETWSDLVWPTLLIIIGALLLYRYYHPPANPQDGQGSGVSSAQPKAENLESKTDSYKSVHN